MALCCVQHNEEVPDLERVPWGDLCRRRQEGEEDRLQTPRRPRQTRFR